MSNTSTLDESLRALETLRRAIEASGNLSEETQRKIEYKFRLECNYHSNRIEGGTLTKPETRSVMVGNITVKDKPLKDIREMQGHDEVMQQILRIGQSHVRLSERRIKDIHKAIIVAEKPEDAAEIGSWKTSNNHIINYRLEKFEFVPPSDVPEAMHQLLNWLNAGLDSIHNTSKDAPHPLLLAFEFHLRYLTIHPFSDGNGRTARLLTNLVLISLGYPPFWVAEGGEKDAYNRYLADVQCYKGSPDLLYAFLAGLVQRSLQITLDAIAGKAIEDVDDWVKKVRLLKSSLPESAAVAQMKSAASIHEAFQVSVRPTLDRLLEQFAEFDDLFVARNIFFGNDDQHLDIKSVKDILNFWEAHQTLNVLTLHYSLKGFKKHERPFDASLELLWKFDDYDYVLVLRCGQEQELLRRKYAQMYSETDVANIVTACGECFFTQIDKQIHQTL